MYNYFLQYLLYNQTPYHGFSIMLNFYLMAFVLIVPLLLESFSSKTLQGWLILFICILSPMLKVKGIEMLYFNGHQTRKGWSIPQLFYSLLLLFIAYTSCLLNCSSLLECKLCDNMGRVKILIIFFMARWPELSTGATYIRCSMNIW